MTQYATLNPLGSTSPYDLFDNAQNFDFAINDITNAIWQDRFGRNRQTWYGLEQLAKAAIAAFGYITLKSFQAGAPLPNNELTLPNQALQDETDGEYYRWDGSFPKEVPSGSTPASTGGIGIGAWLSVGDASLRSDMAKPAGTNLIGAKNGETLSTVLANRWVNSGADRKEILFDLPLIFPDYDAILAANPTWTFIYPGSFTIGDDDKIYIHYGPSDNSSTKRFVVVYSSSGSYLGYLQTDSGGTGTFNSAVSEGIIVTSYYGGLKMFLGSFDGFLFEYDIASVVYGSSITKSAQHQVGLYNQFSFLNGLWAVEQNAPSLGQYRQRNAIAYFNSAFANIGHTQLSVFDSGYITSTTTPYGELMTKRQGLCLAPGVLLGSFGGVFITGTTTEAPTNYQGVKAFSCDGTKILETLASPTKFIAALIASGRGSTRIENEGICYHKGQVFTLWVDTDRSQAFSATGGVLITKEFSMTPNLDLSGAAVVPPGYNQEKMSSGVFPRILDGAVLKNPITGAAMASMSDVMDFMQYSGQKKVEIYTASTPLNDLNGVSIPIGTKVVITTLNNLTFDIETTSIDRVKTYRASFNNPGYTADLALGCETRMIRLNGSDDTGTVTFNRIVGRTRGNTAEVDANQILILDQQNNSSALSVLTIGGGSGLYRSASLINFATNPSMTGLGGTTRWRMDETSLRPFADNAYSLGNGSLRPTIIYAATGTINTSDAREKTDPLPIDDAVLDAWGDVQFITFQWLEAIRQKGGEVAREHFGVIAQHVRDAFIARGLDGTRYGLLCYDEWEDVYEPELALRENLDTGELEEYSTGEMTLVMSKGNRWGIRPDQCLFLEAAYQRRRCDRIEERLARLEGN